MQIDKYRQATQPTNLFYTSMCKKDQSVGSKAHKPKAIDKLLLLVGCARCAVILLLLVPSPLAKEEETAVARDLHSRSYQFCFNEQCGKWCWLVLLLLATRMHHVFRVFSVACCSSQAKPSQAKPSQAKPSQAKPSQAKPSQAKPSQAKPSQAMRCDAMRCDAMRCWMRCDDGMGY
jgi:hypothetical protein